MTYWFVTKDVSWAFRTQEMAIAAALHNTNIGHRRWVIAKYVAETNYAEPIPQTPTLIEAKDV